MKGKYYFVPLQTRTDFQLTQYSKYPNIENFIREVLLSFSKHSPANTVIDIKHHPMERGMSTYSRYIDKVARQYNIHHRVIIIFDVHLPTCLKNAIGTITINSTVGLSSLFHNTPTITLGNAIYDIDGLTCYGMELDNFWTNYSKPDRKLFLKFRSHVISTTQLNGGFYGRFPEFSQRATSEMKCRLPITNT
jgi:capsular polysaccharide export protein